MQENARAEYNYIDYVDIYQTSPKNVAVHGVGQK